MDHSPRQIKPLIKERFYLRSIYTYKDCLIRRPKNILNLECKYSEEIDTISAQTTAQYKLLKALKLLKPVKKVDLSQFEVLNSQTCQTTLLSALKSISKVPTVKIEKHHPYHNRGRNTSAKWLKPLKNLRNLTCRVIFLNENSDFLHRQDHNPAHQIRDPLKYLKCCPKILSLTIDVPDGYLRTFKLQKYPTSLKHLFLDVELDQHEDQNLVIPFQRFKALESVYLVFNQIFCQEFVVRNVEELSKIPNLQKLILQFEGRIFPAIHPTLQKIAQRNVLKKFSLTCINHYPSEETLQVLQDFDQLTHFKISVFVANSQELRKISQSIQNMRKLEYINVGINNRTKINAGQELQIMCQYINNFDSLRHLRLFVNDISRGPMLPSIVPSLHKILTKPIPLEFLSISCNQLDPAQTCADLADVLMGRSASLHTLELYFGIYSPEKQVQETIIRLIGNLQSLRVLTLRGHVINSKSYLEKIINQIHQLKYLRELTFGKIEKDIITPSLFEDILSKRGLASFICKVPHTFMYNPRSIIKKNPSLECCELSSHENEEGILEELYMWDFHLEARAGLTESFNSPSEMNDSDLSLGGSEDEQPV